MKFLKFYSNIYVKYLKLSLFNKSVSNNSGIKITLWN